MTTIKFDLRQVGLGFILIAWLGVAFYMTNVLEPEMKMWLHYEEELAQLHKAKGEVELFREVVEGQARKIKELGEEVRRIRCQQNMFMAASRSGWRKAERLISTGLFHSTCGTDEWDDDEAIVADE